MVERTRLVDAKVGGFVLIALIILVVGSLWVAGSSWLGVRQVGYEVLLRDSGGVHVGDRVRYAGVSVGRVQDVRLQPADADWPVSLRVTLDPEVPLRMDSTAHIATEGLLGASILVIESGSADQDALPPGGIIHGTKAGGIEEALAHVDEISEMAIALIDQVSDMLTQASEDIEPLLEKAQTLLSDENTENVRVMLAGLRETTDEVSPRVGPLLGRLESLTATMEQDMASFPELTDQAGELLDSLQTALGPDGERLARVLDAAESSLDSADETLSTLSGSRLEIEWTLRDLRDAVANLKAFSQQVKERPFSLVRIKTEPDRQPGQGVGEKP